MESAAPSVAVVIPTWNSIALLPRCLDSLAAQGVLEVFVVDNGSTDGTVELLRERGIPHLTLPENRGFAVAMDLGVERTTAPLVLALNADTELEPGAVAAMAAALAAEPGRGGVAPLILQVEGDGRDINRARVYSAGQGLTRDGRGVELGAGGPRGPGTTLAREIFGACGAACLLRRELFTQLGGYDRDFFSFFEDVDLNVRAQIAGWSFAYAPEAVVWHLGNAFWIAGVPQPAAWNARLVARNRIVTQARFMPASSLPRILAVEAGSLFRAARQRRLRATACGKLEGLIRIPAALRERRRLSAMGDLSRPRSWLGRS